MVTKPACVGIGAVVGFGLGVIFAAVMLKSAPTQQHHPSEKELIEAMVNACEGQYSIDELRDLLQTLRSMKGYSDTTPEKLVDLGSQHCDSYSDNYADCCDCALKRVEAVYGPRGTW